MLYEYDVFEYLEEFSEEMDIDFIYDFDFDDNDGDTLKIISKGIKKNVKHASNSIENTYKKYSKIFLEVNEKKTIKENIKELFRAISYIKFLYFWQNLNNSGNFLDRKVHTMAFDDFFVNQLKREEKIAKNVLRLNSKILKNWQLDILKNVKIYTISDKKIEKFNSFNFFKYISIKRSFFSHYMYEFFWDSIFENLNHRGQDIVDFLSHKVINGIYNFKKSYDKDYNSIDENDLKNYRLVESISEEKDLYNFNIENEVDEYDYDTNVFPFSDTYEREIELVSGTNNSDFYSYFYILPNYSFENFSQEKIIESLGLLSKGNYNLESEFSFSLILETILSLLYNGTFQYQTEESNSLFYLILETILFKIYDRRENLSNFKNFSKNGSFRQVTRLNEKFFEKFLNDKKIYKKFLLPKEEKSIQNEENKNFLICFLEQNDISDIAGFLVNKTASLKNFLGPYTYEIVERDLGFIYEEYLEKLKKKVNNSQNEKDLEILIVPSFKNLKNPLENFKNYLENIETSLKTVQTPLELENLKTSLKTLKKHSIDFFLDLKRENIFEELSSINFYLLDLSLDVPSLKIQNLEKDNSKIFFYPLKNKKIDLYLPYSFEKNNLLNFYETLKRGEGILGKLIKKNHLKISTEPKIIETNLNEFLNLTKGFGLKNRKIITIKC